MGASLILQSSVWKAIIENHPTLRTHGVVEQVAFTPRNADLSPADRATAVAVLVEALKRIRLLDCLVVMWSSILGDHSLRQRLAEAVLDTLLPGA